MNIRLLCIIKIVNEFQYPDHHIYKLIMIIHCFMFMNARVNCKRDVQYRFLNFKESQDLKPFN